MTDASSIDETQGEDAPRAHVRVVYLGPFAPQWEVEPIFGDAAVVNPFRDRVLARLTLLPPNDPQFKRNRERVLRDAERERIAVDWEMGGAGDPDPAPGTPTD